MKLKNGIKKIGLIIILICQLTFLQEIKAEIKLPAIISSNMVLQRNSTVVIWGWAEANEKIDLEASWLNKLESFQADSKGNWRIELKTTNSKEAQIIRIKDKSSNITLDNILFGEVWLCSGQSNMEQPIRGYIGQPVFKSNMATAKSNNPNLRLFTVKRNGSKEPLKDVDGHISWESASSESVSDFSAIGYFFGRQLQEILDCPVGIIHSSWGGSSIRAWVGDETIANYQKDNSENVEYPEGIKYEPTTLFNAMINPLLSFRIKGVLWYQGETNRKEPENYRTLFPSMVKNWRDRWGIGNFPFYYVQIAPYLYGNNDVFQTPENSAFIREVQLQSLDLIPNSGIAITMDIGEGYTIHPPRKKDVADRLLFNALQQTYSYKSIDYSGPVYDSFEIKADEIILKFKQAETGLFSFNKLEGFEIAGQDKVFYPATAEIANRTMDVIVKSDLVPSPVAVRYCWRNWVVGTLFDTQLLPASSFRTDEWNNAKRIKN
jgi:sialate O-acetylesterase